jgi:hypothetical protein
VPFEYAVIRVVPRVERGESFNAGIVLFSRARAFLDARVDVDEALLAAMSPGSDAGEVRRHLDAIPRVCAAESSAGPIARLPLPERFRWLTAKSSTMVQPSEVHGGLTDDPAAELEHLFRSLVVRR